MSAESTRWREADEGSAERYGAVGRESVRGFTLFDTAVGPCGIAWSERGIAAVQLPEAREAETRARLVARCPGAREAPPPPDAQRALDGIVALLRGEASELGSVALDMSRMLPFYQRVYEVVRTIPPGATLSYGEVAARLGAPGSARDVGQALGRNPFALLVPCHRVLAAGGKIGGFSARGGVSMKRRLLAIEHAPAGDDLFNAPPDHRRPSPAWVSGSPDEASLKP